MENSEAIVLNDSNKQIEGENTHKEKRKINDGKDESRRATRKKTKIDRLGLADTDYNACFEDDETNSNTIASTSLTGLENAMNDREIAALTDHGNTTNVKCNCIELLQLLLKKSEAIQDHLIKLHVKLNHIDSTPPTRKLKIVHIDMLKKFGLPTETESELDNLDKKLKNDIEFKTELSNCVERIGGDEGNANGETVLEKITCSLINPPYLAEISWTGKGKQKERKIALCRFNHLIDFIKAMTFKADKSFTEAQFKDKLIYGILKRAPSKYGASNSKNDAKESEGEASQSSNSHVEKTAYIPTPPPQSTPTQLQQPAHHSSTVDTNHYPPNSYSSNGQPPIAYYPPHQHHQFNPYQQQQFQYYGLSEWPTGAHPTHSQPPSTNTQPTPTYFSM